jgi:hypothetical protein
LDKKGLATVKTSQIWPFWVVLMVAFRFLKFKKFLFSQKNHDQFISNPKASEAGTKSFLKMQAICWCSFWSCFIIFVTIPSVLFLVIKHKNMNN